jgi:glycosyltransferase involved in cell wall biosynthesis
MTPRQRISVICPVFNEEPTIPLFYDRFSRAVAPLRQRYDVELIFTNNRSTDRTLDVILSLRGQDPTVQVVTLSRNFGYQASLQAGLSIANGDAVMFIDVDCEDPPEMIPRFVEKWEEGYDVVYGERGNRPEWFLIKKLRDYFYHVLKTMGDAEIVLYMAEFALFSRQVKDSIVNNQNTFPYIRAEIGYVGFARYGVRYNRERRVSGQTHYNIIDMIAAAVGAVLTSSTFPMRVAANGFPAIVLLNLLLLFADSAAGDFVLFKVLVTFDLLFLLLLVSTYGLYIARIHKNLMGRPIFVIDKRLTVLNDPAPPVAPSVPGKITHSAVG